MGSAMQGRSRRGLAGRLGRDLPWYLPGVAQGMFARAPALSDRVREAGRDACDLSVLLSRVLLAFTLDYEQDARLSLTDPADLAATGVSRQVRGHIDSHKTHFARRDHRK